MYIAFSVTNLIRFEENYLLYSFVKLDNTAFRPNALIKENDIAFVDKSSIIFKDFAFL